MIHISKVLTALYPEASWSLQGNTYEGITWLSKNIEMPSKELVEAEVARLTAELSTTEYQRLRQPEYPPLADLADALYWQAQGDSTKMDQYLAAVAAVKEKYPKL